MMYKGEEIAKPLRKTMKKLAQVAHHEKHCAETRRGKLTDASDETHWGIVGQRRTAVRLTTDLDRRTIGS